MCVYSYIYQVQLIDSNSTMKMKSTNHALNISRFESLIDLKNANNDSLVMIISMPSENCSKHDDDNDRNDNGNNDTTYHCIAIVL